jgi:undecaprenyl-phosphate 4-deoxy-4-formamido-L-arabinose transferase
MLRAYSIDIVRATAASREVSTFIPALAYTFAHSPESRSSMPSARPASRNTAIQADPAQLDLITGFSPVPLQLFSMFGMIVSAGAVLVRT